MAKKTIRPGRFVWTDDSEIEVVEFGVDDETGDSEERDAELLAEQKRMQEESDVENS